MEDHIERSRLRLEAEIRKRVIADCIHNTHAYINSREWEIFANKFRALNLNLRQDLIECKLCEEPISGHYFNEEKKIIICANHVVDSQFNYTVSHELVHLYDHARAELDFKDPKHIACSEIRATNLSGECRPAKFYKWMNRMDSYIKCVKEQAIASVQFNLKDHSREDIERTVDSVWDVCYFDYEPFTFEELSKKLKGRSF